MREIIQKAMRSNQPVDMIYMDKTGQITKRRVKIIKLQHDAFQAYCFTKQAKRTFLIQNVLAITPYSKKERSII